LTRWGERRIWEYHNTLRTEGVASPIVRGIAHDVTEHKRSEKRLQEYERVVEGLDEMIVVIDRHYRYLIANHAYLKYRGMEREQVIGHRVPEVVGKEVFETIVKEKMDECFKGTVVRYELQYGFPDLGQRDIFASYFPIEGPTGVDRLAMVLRDITEHKRAEEELRLAKERLAEEKIYLEEAIDTELGFGEIIGQSKALREVLEQVARVAATDATVLILGETGTGKELVARAIHSVSRRHNNSFIKVNCAAIPSGLLESELFGHEKGAFTGAVARKTGRLELADQGTLFLDEIGDIPMVLQPKLLRVLQDQEFERLGSIHTLKVNFRLIAATNRDFSQGVEDGQFRSDLYYRLNVFPVRVPPLRERREDIPLLVQHFVLKCAKRMNKAITSIPAKTMETLKQWDWPGNIRELENFVERSVILTHGSVLQSPLKELESAGEQGITDTLEAMDREHIVRALQLSHGKLSGINGAAERLGINRTTLQSKLKRLGINPERYRD
jgi:PAS domain S-box-containing protein